MPHLKFDASALGTQCSDIYPTPFIIETEHLENRIKSVTDLKPIKEELNTQARRNEVRSEVFMRITRLTETLTSYREHLTEADITEVSQLLKNLAKSI